MPITVVALTELTPEPGDALDRYLAVTGALMDAAGARIVERYERVEIVSGTTVPQFVTIIEYPDHAAVRRVFDDPDYLALAPMRDAAFQRYEIAIMR